MLFRFYAHITVQTASCSETDGQRQHENAPQGNRVARFATWIKAELEMAQRCQTESADHCSQKRHPLNSFEPKLWTNKCPAGQNNPYQVLRSVSSHSFGCYSNHLYNIPSLANSCRLPFFKFVSFQIRTPYSNWT